MRGSQLRVAIVATVVAATFVGFAPRPVESQAVRASYAYTLASFTGPIGLDWSRVAVDRQRNEVYALYQNGIRVFNDAGMEVYHFGDDLDVGHILDVAIDEAGDILLLTYRDSAWAIVRCDYRGRQQSRIILKGLPADLAGFAPNRMVWQRGAFYLASTLGLTIVTADRDGRVIKAYDLFPLFELEEKDRGNVELGGFSVDGDGNMLMTAPVLFRAFVLTPDGTLNMFGKASSAPGGFNIAAGIARDGRGNILVVDRLKGAVLVFDERFTFVTQFSRRGYRPGELVYPADLAVDGRDRVYVTQMGRRGVSVFRMTYL